MNFLRIAGVSLVIPILCGVALGESPPDELFLRGYTLIPSPREVQLQNDEFELNEPWFLDPGPEDSDSVAVRSLIDDLRNFYGIQIRMGQGARMIRLDIQPGVVDAPEEVHDQAYLMNLRPDSIEIQANGRPGLFYGVQTLIQLVKVEENRNLLPVSTLRDWPHYKLRSLHWDTKHHHDRLETLKRYLDWAARFKVNMIGFELEDKFEYPSHPVIGAPGAFTSEELQEITDYGLARHIQVVPTIQSPAHMAYVLKHPEFAHLRADGNNYQSCLCDEETYDLIFSMYQDVIDANQGVDYFHASTDEVYYAGICEKCDRPYNEENRSLAWVEFINRAHDFLKARGRRMLAWVEYPVWTEHISKLPPDLIDGVLGSDADFIRAENERGIRQMVYTSMQGSEYLFPNYWSAESGDFRSRRGRLQSTFQTLSHTPPMAAPIGVFGAAWDDSGLHNETFWLGWSTVAQYGWTPGSPSVEQHVSEFMDTYYGPEVVGMPEIYRELQNQARFFQRSWDRVVSRAREPGYGNSYGKGIGTTRRDDTLPAPALPKLPDLKIDPVYQGDRYRSMVEEAARYADGAGVLLQKIYDNIQRADRNRHNLEVLLSLARLTRHHDRMIVSLKRAEELLEQAAEASGEGEAERAVYRMVSAFRLIQNTVSDRKDTYLYLRAIWEKSRFEKGRSVGNREFHHVLDDVKDHWADRRADLSYMLAPEESINLEGWLQSLSEVIREYAREHQVAVDSIQLEVEPEE